MSACRQARRRVLARLDGTLALEEEFRLERHLGQCTACATYAHDAAELEEGLARLPEPPTVRLDVEGAVSAIRARLAADAPRARRPVLRRVAVAAIALFGASAWLVLATREREEPAPRHAAAILPESSMVDDRELVAELELPQPLPAEEPLDPERLARAREELRVLLAESSARFDLGGGPAEAIELAAFVDARVPALGLQRWPVGRIAAGLLEGTDAAVARAAARYLGARPEPTTAMALRRALARPELAEACVCALADLGTSGLEGLAYALELPALRDEALAAVVSIGGPEAAAVLARELRAGDAVPEMLLASLAELGAPAVSELLALAADGVVGLESFLFGVERIEGAAFELVRQLEAGPRGARAAFVLHGATQLAPELATPGLERAAHERATRGTAVDCLASIQDPQALMALLRLRDTGRVPPDLIAPALHDSVELNAAHLLGAVTAAAARTDHDELATLLELVVANEARAAAPVLGELARIPWLDPELRSTALLALVELGDAAQVELLVQLLSTFDARERRLAAACLLAIHALGGDAAVETALASLPARAREEVLTQLGRVRARDLETVSLVQLARALAPTLGRSPRPGDG